MFIGAFLVRHRSRLIISAVLSLINAALTFLLLMLINRIVAVGVKQVAPMDLLSGVGCLVGLLCVGFASQSLLAHLGGEMVADLRSELSSRFIRVEYERLREYKSPILGSLIEDIGRIAPLALIVPQLAYQALLVVLYCGYMVAISPLLFAVLASFISLVAFASVIFSSAIGKAFDAHRESEEAVFDCFRAISDGKKEMSVSSPRAEHFTGSVLKPAIAAARVTMVAAHIRVGFNNAWSVTVSYASVFAIAYTGRAVFHLTDNVLTHFVVVALFLMGPIAFVTQMAQQVATGMASVRHLNRLGLILETSITTPVASASELLNDCWEQLVLQGVRYVHPSSASDGYELGPLDLTIRRGETLFLVGGNGGGKSTLLLLLCGLLTPTAGQILIDGVPVRNNIAAYRRLFAGVFGDFHLFADVVNDQGHSVDDDTVAAWLHALMLGDKVSSSQGRLSELSLSTGQRKRLALLQTQAQDRTIYFFDEWAADQDAHFRNHFYRSILPTMKRMGKTLIVISHDDRYFDAADRVVKLDSGRIVATDFNAAAERGEPAEAI
ncbi:putative ATP-binding cassette transporter [Rhodanobacter sp. ANJX3]|uniref:cyclic peptide export ABC transporter n=1 Tax=Rhodanobacter sp. ANJX3 TaxID=2723083 RepID=UPI001798C79F|nr:cyclic peptide export ABC transporter [Rhodanobacter sp. ANJX3]MBB5360913.1 putative ATP-binding cassette transporter [Rhodanobacter sp. ANJX3]